MKKFIKTIGTVGSAALILSGTAWADPPVTFGQWSVNGSSNVVFNYGGAATCPTGYTCATPTTGAGFLQRQITHTASGNRYFQTVITPDNAVSQTSAQVSFADESFVRLGSTGVSSSQRATDTSVSGVATTDFTTSTIVNAGWAAGGATYKDLEISQTETVTNNKATASAEVVLYNGFTFNQNGTSAAPTGKFMDVTQGVLITAGATLGSNADDDVQKFVMREASGNLNGAAHTLGTPVLLPGSSTGTDVAWSATDNVKVTYVGQQMVASGVESFRYQFYDNVTSAAADSISNFEVGASSPWTWVNPFGTSPTLTVP